MRRGDVGTAMQLNQLGYSHLPAFRGTNNTQAGRIADNSFDNMLTNMRGHGIDRATGPNQNQVTPSMTRNAEVEVRLSRESARSGRWPSYEDELDMLHRTTYGRR